MFLAMGNLSSAHLATLLLKYQSSRAPISWGGANRRAGEGISFEVVIGNSVWVGAKSSFMGNIIVGDSAIVGACALVNKNVEPNTCVGGIPAKLLKKL